MTAIIIDLVLAFIVGLCIANGCKKGLILSVSGFIALILAIFGAKIIAETYSGEITPMLEPIVTGIIDDSFSDAMKNSGEPVRNKEEQVYNVTYDSLTGAGLLQAASERIANEIKEDITEVGQGLKSMIVEKVCASIAYVAVFVVAFLLIIIIVTVAANLLNLVFALPGLELLNDIGGGLFGFARGLLFLWLIAWAVQFIGIIIPEGLVEKTILLEWITKVTPIGKLLGV